MSTTDRAHPSPHRHRVGLGALLFGLFGGPAMWLGQLIVDFGLASHGCYPAALPLAAPAPGWQALWPGLLAVNLLAILLSAFAAFLSFRNWRATRAEHPGSSDDLLEAGEGRTRFLALAGTMTGIGFAGAAIFDTIVLLGTPICNG